MRRWISPLLLGLIFPAVAHGNPTTQMKLRGESTARSMGTVTKATYKAKSILYEGSFTDTQAKVPKGYPPPTGTKLLVTFHEADGSVEELSLTGKKAPIARASTWGTNCQSANPYHCYSIAEWVNEGPAVDMTLAYITSAESSSNSHYFVDSEQWDIFKNGYWYEQGQEIGPDGCCEYSPFLAKQNAEGYWQYTPTWIKIGRTPTMAYETVYSPAITAGTWCAYWYGTPVSNPIHCEGGFGNRVWEINVGMEAAEDSAPSIWGEDNTYISVGSGWYHWNAVSGFYHQGGTCIGPNTDTPATGNIVWGTAGRC